MRALLDTHTFIWWANNDSQLTDSVREVISDRTNEIFLSSVSTWEMAIKMALGKLALSQPLADFVASQISQYQFKPLLITYVHTYGVESLPTHHNDPFDRLLISQATAEGLVLLTGDDKFAPYNITTVW